MKNQKSYERDQLIREFGILMQPLEALARQDQPPSATDYRIAVAKVRSGDAEWRQGVRRFTTFSSDLWFPQEYNEISHVPERLWARVQSIIDDPALGNDPPAFHSKYRELVRRANDDFFRLINCVPVEWEPELFEANTPFTSYLKIKESLAALRARLHYFDPYLKPEFFDLFLRGVNRAVSVRLVTTKLGVDAVAAVSDLCRSEFTDYQLIQVHQKHLHDRNLRVDNEIFSLGPGVARAGIKLTNFGPADSSETAHNAFDSIIAGGSVVHRS